MAEQPDGLRLRPEDITHFINLLKRSTSPLTTQELVGALKQRAGHQ